MLAHIPSRLPRTSRVDLGRPAALAFSSHGFSNSQQVHWFMRSCDKPADASEPTADVEHFCPEMSESTLFAVLGIFTVDEHDRHRREIRSTWLASPVAIHSYFVLCGLGALKRTIDEARAQGDMIFLQCPARMPCMQGTLRKLISWLRCAQSAWPSASLIGKADDDTWVHLPDVERTLRHTLLKLALEQPHASPLLYWGSMESYHWDLEMRRPVGFRGLRFAFRLLPAGSWSGSGRFEYCHRRLAPNSSSALVRLAASRELPREWLADASTVAASGSIVGPFPFAKGPLYFLSAQLAARVTSDPWVQAELRTLSREIGVGAATRAEKTWAWEDVFLGLALSMVTNGSALNLFAVDAGEADHFSSLWETGLKLAPTTALWHPVTWGVQRRKSVDSIGRAHVWQRTHHCSLAIKGLLCHNYTSCAGGRWRSCYSNFVSTNGARKCSPRLVDLLASRSPSGRLRG